MKTDAYAILCGIGLAILGMVIWSVWIIRDYQKEKQGKGIDW